MLKQYSLSSMKTLCEMTLERGLGNLSLADSQYNAFDGSHINPELSVVC